MMFSVPILYYGEILEEFRYFFKHCHRTMFLIGQGSLKQDGI